MSLKLKDARSAFKSRVESVAAIKMVAEDQVPEGVDPPRDWAGEMSPYAVLHFGRPGPDYGRTLTDGEGDYPHTWPVYVELVVGATSSVSVSDLADDLDAALINW